jgi:hypothetical protein
VLEEEPTFEIVAQSRRYSQTGQCDWIQGVKLATFPFGLASWNLVERIASGFERQCFVDEEPVNTAEQKSCVGVVAGTLLIAEYCLESSVANVELGLTEDHHLSQ